MNTSELTIAVDSFSDMGLTFTTTAVTESNANTWPNATVTPQFTDLAWLPDYPDPIGQQLMSVYDASDGGAFGGNDAWVDNATLQGIFINLDFENVTVQEKAMYNVQNLTYNQYAYMWLPVPNNIWFVAPDVHGFVYNTIISAYFYNLMTVSGKLTSSVGFISVYALVASMDVAIINIAPKF